MLYWLVYRAPHVIVATTQLAKQQLVQRFHIPESKIQVISIGLNEEMPLTSLTTAEARKRLGYPPTDNLILFFGKIDRYKGVDTLIEAFDCLEVPSLKLIIAGAFPNSEYRDAIISIVGAAQRKADIHLYNKIIPNEEVEVYFKCCDLLVLPYRNIYQSGLVFLSFRFGIPVVATNVGSLRDFIEEDTGIITKTNDAAGLAEAILRFFQNRHQFSRERIVAKGEKYRWENICNTLIPLYNTSEVSPQTVGQASGLPVAVVSGPPQNLTCSPRILKVKDSSLP